MTNPNQHETTCSECLDRCDTRPLCPGCLGQAKAWAADAAVDNLFSHTHELYAGLDDCAIAIPETWYDKPILRFARERDDGDGSVGIGPREAWVFASDQAGTLLADLIARETPLAMLLAAAKKACNAPRVAPPETIGYGEQSIKAFAHGWHAAMEHVWRELGDLRGALASLEGAEPAAEQDAA